MYHQEKDRPKGKRLLLCSRSLCFWQPADVGDSGSWAWSAICRHTTFFLRWGTLRTKSRDKGHRRRRKYRYVLLSTALESPDSAPTVSTQGDAGRAALLYSNILPTAASHRAFLSRMGRYVQHGMTLEAVSRLTSSTRKAVWFVASLVARKRIRMVWPLYASRKRPSVCH